MKQRETNIEILRIISMFLIIGYHAITNGLVDENFDVWIDGLLINKIISASFFPAGRIGVMIFFMITGYFLIDKEKVNPLKIIIKTLFYIFLITVIFIVLQYTIKIYDDDFSWKLYCIKNIFTPFSSITNWFVTNYIILLLCLPYINQFLKKLTLKGFLLFIIILDFFSYGFGNVLGYAYEYLYETLLFYACGVFYKKYIKDSKKRKLSIAIIILIIFIFLSIFLSYKYFCFQVYNNFYYSLLLNYLIKTIIVPVLSFILFDLFLYLPNYQNIIINKLASVTLSVYLIHGSVFQNYLWTNLAKIKELYNSKFFIFNLYGIIFFIYLICFFIDFFLQKFMIDHIYNKINEKIKTCKERYFIE